MPEQLYFEDLHEGMDIPGLTRETSLQTMVMYCGAYEDFAGLHYDPEYAKAAGFDRPVVPGLFTSALLTRILTDWVSPGGRVRRIRTSYRRPQLAGDTIVCKGRVSALRTEGDEHLAEVEVWAESPDGQMTTPGTALIVLPSRAGAG